MEHITDLGGHSGCKILLIETDNNTTFVRKIAGHENYNKRLELQAEKQERFNSRTIKAPKVLYKSYEGGVFHFDMEYIQGITLAEYMKSVEIGKIRGIVNLLVDNLVGDNNSDPYVSSAEGDEAERFTEKISSLNLTLKGKSEIVDRALKKLGSHDWSNIQQSKCHGDLTLENIIVKDGQLYFIDFLDSFYDSWIMDASTLMQDVQTMWSYRFDENNINTALRLIVFRDLLMDQLKERATETWQEVYYALLLKLIRIYPYTKDEETLKFLDDKVLLVLSIIGKTEESSEKKIIFCRE